LFTFDVDTKVSCYQYSDQAAPKEASILVMFSNRKMFVTLYYKLFRAANPKASPGVATS